MRTAQKRLRLHMNCRIFLLVVWLTVPSVSANGQIDPASSVVDDNPHAAADAKPAMAFDVVSIKLDKSGVDSAAIESQQGSDAVSIRNLALEWIVDFAYNFDRPELVSGLPEWAKTDKYDIVAKVSGPEVDAFRKLDIGQRKLMLRALLEDRFQLKLHRELKESSVYALTVAKSGVKMKLATSGDTYANGPKYPNGRPAGADTLTPTAKGLVGQGVQMEKLALMLSKIALGREVVDKTGLTGRYDFTLRFSPTEAMRPVINGQMQALTPDEEALPSVFTAVQEQLGLRLEPEKGQVEGLVVDHVERPSED